MLDLGNMTLNEVEAGLEQGTIQRKDLCDFGGIIGAAFRFLMSGSFRKSMFDDPPEFPIMLARVLPYSGKPPQLGRVAQELGCDAKTVLKYTDKHWGVHTWGEFLASLISGEIKLPDPDGTQDPSQTD